MYTVTFTDGKTLQLPAARGYRIDKKTGTLTVWGKHFSTLCAYPKGYWASISQIAPEVDQ
ncbi:hypothetical protein BPY_06940 [Bifidobacterium psychraerophilum]|uniref:hypothetical protein n=1 Tax=Bifidobacterium psychraerophilum TaxID=218140 RepID=UPI00310FE7C5